MTRILIADDNPQVLRALCHLVEQDSQWKVCAVAVDGRDAVQRVKETSPDVVVLDYQMPAMNGLQAAEEIAKVAPDVPVLLCTAHLSAALVHQAKRAGIDGAVSKLGASDILNGIRALLRHEQYYLPLKPEIM